MVVYTCDVCKKKFVKKFEYASHMNKIKKCSPNENHIDIDDFKCKICKVTFSRKDTLKRHNETKKHKANVKINKQVNINNNNNNNQIKYNNIKGNLTVENKNKNINNYYYISPFAQEEINKLSIIEKMSTLLSQENPIIEIILITNLNPNKPEYHNIGYTDLKSGYGIIFNGKTWERKEINAIINELLAKKKNDLFKIKLEINQYLSDEHKKIIEEKLQNVKDNVEPRLEHHVKSKGKLLTNIKTHFYNGKNMIQEAIKNSGAPIEGIKTENNNLWMNEYNFEEIEKQINLINSKKELAKYILKNTHHLDHKTIMILIDSTENIDEINMINRLLTKSMINKNDINEEIIKEEILKDKQINDMLFDNK